MSAQGEKNTLLKPGETPAVSEKTESEISDEKGTTGTGKEDDKADISIQIIYRSGINFAKLSYFVSKDLGS